MRFVLVFILLLSIEKTALIFAEESSDAPSETEVTKEIPEVAESEPTPDPATPPTPVAEPVGQAVTPSAPVPPPSTEAPTTQSPFAVGIQGGQTLTNSSLSGNRQKTEIFGGAHIEWRLMDQLMLQAELNYLEKGWRPLTGLPQDEVSLKYLEVPLFLKVKWAWNNLAPHVFAGPSLGYLHAAERMNNGIPFDTTSGTTRIEYGIYVGAGLDILVSNDLEVGGNIRYGWGLSGLSKDVLEPDVFNRVFQWVATLRFRL